jgi:hypothetical protein
MKVILISSVIALAAFSFAASASFAQYPQLVGNLTCNISATTTAPGSLVTVSATARDATGVPLSGRTEFFTITSQPGGAIISPSAGATNLSGVASAILSVGSQPGAIVVTVTSESATAQCLVQVPVPVPVPVPAPASVAPVAQVQGVSQIAVARTGDAGLRSDASSGFGIAGAGYAFAAVLAALGFAIVIRHRLQLR